MTPYMSVPTDVPYLRVDVQTIGFRCVLSVRGEIDMATVGILQSALDHPLESGLRDIWIDLSEVSFMDSSGLNALVAADHALTAHSGQLTVICPAGPIRRTLDLTGLDRALNIRNSRAEAHHLS